MLRTPHPGKRQTQNHHAGGPAAPVAGYAGPGFHTWPSGHIPQDTAPKPLLRIRSPAKKTFGETFGKAFGKAFGAATGVSDPRLQKIRIRNNHAAAKPPLSPGTLAPVSTRGPQTISYRGPRVAG